MACPMFLGHGHHHLNWHAGMGVGLQYLQYVACVLLLIENILSVFFTYIRCESATSQTAALLDTFGKLCPRGPRFFLVDAL